MAQSLKKQAKSGQGLGVIAKEIKVTPTTLRKALVSLGIIDTNGMALQKEYVVQEYETDEDELWTLFDKEKITNAYFSSIGKSPKYVTDDDVKKKDKNIRKEQMAMLSVIENSANPKKAIASLPTTMEMIYTTDFNIPSIQDIFLEIINEIQRSMKLFTTDEMGEVMESCAYIIKNIPADVR